MITLNLTPTIITLDETFASASSTPQNTDLYCAPAAGVTFAIEAMLMVSSADPDGAAPQIGVAWPDGCARGAAEIVDANGDRTAGNVGAPIQAATAALPDVGTWPMMVRATFVAGDDPSGSFAITLASSDGVTEVRVGAGSWLRVWPIGG